MDTARKADMSQYETPLHNCDSLPTVDKSIENDAQPFASIDELMEEEPKDNDLLSIQLPSRPSNKTLLFRWFNHNNHPDLTIVIDGSHLKCHSMVLRASSSLFSNLDRVEVVHLPADKVSKCGFISTYNCLVSPKPEVHQQMLIEIFCTSKFLGIDCVQNFCWKLFENDYNSEDQAVLLFQEARTYSVFIRHIMFSRFQRCFLTYVASKEYRELSDIEVCDLLSRNTIGVNTEEEVFFAAVVWLSYKWPERKEVAKSVMECVRFAQMPLGFLSTFTKRRDTAVIEYLATNHEIRVIIGQCMDNLGDFMSRGHKHIDFFTKRLWIFDPKCGYHHTTDCKWISVLTYVCFINYLEQLQTRNRNHYLSFKGENDKDISCCPVYDKNTQKKLLHFTSQKNI